MVQLLCEIQTLRWMRERRRGWRQRRRGQARAKATAIVNTVMSLKMIARCWSRTRRAENLIGLEEAHVDDPGAQFAVVQRKLEMLPKETKKLEEKERQREAAGQAAVELQAGVEGQREHCKQVPVDVRELAKKMGASYELELECAVSVAERRQRPEGRQTPTRNRDDAQELVP